jgi:L-malate glycosyltransferase
MLRLHLHFFNSSGVRNRFSGHPGLANMDGINSSPTKIMYLIDTYRHPYAGTETQLLKLITGLDESKFSCSITIFRESQYIKENGFPCEVKILNITHLTNFFTFRKIISFAFFLRKNNYKIVHIYFNDASIIAPIIIKLFGCKVIVSRRDMGFWYNKRNLLLLRINRFFVDSIIANSEAVKRNTHIMERYPLSKIHVIYNGYDINQINTDNSSQVVNIKKGDSKIIGIVANIRPIKRIDDLVRALSLVKNKHKTVRLVIVGSGDTLFLNNLTEELGLSDSVDFLGAQTQVLSIIKQFDIAVLCSESEGFSNSIAEYMQCMVPVVCTDTGGNNEIVVDNCTGYLVEVGNIIQLAAKITALLDEPKLGKKMAQNALKKMSAICDMDKMILKQSRIYQ